MLQISIFYFVLKCWKSKKRESLGNWFWSLFQYQSCVFLKYFSLLFSFPNTLFSHTWTITSNPIYRSCFCEENCLWSIVITKYCLWSIVITKFVISFLLWLCALSLLCRGDCGWVWLYTYPSCVEVIVIELWLCALSLLCRGDYVFTFCLSFLCRGDCVLTLSLVFLAWRWLWFGFVPIPLV